MPDEEEKIEVAVGPDFKPPEETQPLTQPEGSPPMDPERMVEIAEGMAKDPLVNWWAEIESEDDLKAHERAKPWLEETQEKAKRELQSALQPLYLQRRNEMTSLQQAGAKMQKEFERAQRDGTVSEELLERWEPIAGQVSGAYWWLGRFDGAKGFLKELSDALGDEDALVKEFVPRIELLEQGAEDKNIGRDLLKRLASTAAGKEAESHEKKGYEKGVADGRRAATEEMRARQRENNGPDLSRKQTAGGTALTPQRYKDMPPDERLKLTPQQIDAMTAELARMSR